jgi:hypothetical protein
MRASAAYVKSAVQNTNYDKEAIMKAYYFAAVVLLLIALSFASEAQIPRTLSYQGVLSDTSGVPKPDGSYALTFRLYETSSGGSAIWTETKTLNTKRGLFYTILADQTPFGSSVMFDKPYWLSIQVATEPEIPSRITLTGVAYSQSVYNTINGSGFSNFMVFNSSGTFTVPSGVTKIMVEVWGGGGGGAGGAWVTVPPNVTLGSSGGGGGGGGYGKDIFSVTSGTNYAVTIGLGGSGGSGSSSGSGGDGGWTTFGASMIGTGGNGGTGSATSDGSGGNGGLSKASISVLGSPGENGIFKNTGTPTGTFGGGTGGGGASPSSNDGKVPGGGGGGNFGSYDGHAGAQGRVIVWW